MPQRPNKPCRHRGCNTLTRNGNGYCEDHQADTVGWKHTKSAADRGYGARWRRLREQVLLRDSGLCRCDDCKRTGRALLATEVDHIKPKAQGGRDEMDNLRAINHDCHKLKTQRESRAGMRRAIGKSTERWQ